MHADVWEEPPRPWDTERFKNVTRALVEEIYSYAEVKQNDANYYISDPRKQTPIEQYVPSAAHYLIRHVSSLQHQRKVPVILQIGGQDFHDYLDYSKQLTMDRKDPFSKYHAVIRDLAVKFDKEKEQNKDNYETEFRGRGLNMNEICLQNAQTQWAGKITKKICTAHATLGNSST